MNTVSKTNYALLLKLSTPTADGGIDVEATLATIRAALENGPRPDASADAALVAEAVAACFDLKEKGSAISRKVLTEAALLASPIHGVKLLATLLKGPEYKGCRGQGLGFRRVADMPVEAPAAEATSAEAPETVQG